MKFVLALVFCSIVTPLAAAPSRTAAAHPFNVDDLVRMERVGDPSLSPDGRMALYQLRQTDYDANKGVTGIWVVATSGNAAPIRLTDKAVNASTPRWSVDGSSVYFLAAKNDVSQIWRVPAGGGVAEPVTSVALDVGAFKLSPDGRQMLLAIDVFTDCPTAEAIVCSKQRLDARAGDKASGLLFDKLFIRHWDTWADGRRSQLFIATIGTDGKIDQPKLLTHGIDGDVPSKPFGDDGEFGFSPDSKIVYFDARIAGNSEPWSTNFDIYSVPADASAAPKNLSADNPAWDGYPLASSDGKTLYYLAMKRPGFEADRFAIIALDLATGVKHEVAAGWDRSASTLKESRDGKTLYTGSDDWGRHALFAIDIASGKATRLTENGDITGFDIGAKGFLLAREDHSHPTDLYMADARGRNLRQITRANADQLKNIEFGATEWFTFKGWNDDTVQGYVVKPANYVAGKKYPVAFIIHGGPQGAMTDDFHYRWNPQTYAGQGFAVVTINFHGSTGYGQAFTDAISQHWGDRPLEDLQKGWAAALDKYSFLDGDNACALGASYGGYMVYWMAGVWNKPWKCLVDHDGVFDSRLMSYSTEELWFDEWEHGGTYYDRPQDYEKFNPVNHVADWRVPMLVVHGQKDFRIPVEQGIAAFTALQRRGIDSKFLYFPDENHWVLKPQNSVLWHNTVNAWLKAHASQ